MAYWRLFYHFIWSTKERLPLIQPDFETELHSVLAAKAVALGAQVYAVGGIDNHIHLAASVSPTFALADFVRQLKGSSSYFVNTSVGVPFKWQREYGIVSFGQKQLPMVIKYIQNQHQHHSGQTEIPFLETTG